MQSPSLGSFRFQLPQIPGHSRTSQGVVSQSGHFRDMGQSLDLIHFKFGCPSGVGFGRRGTPAAQGTGRAAAAFKLSKEPASAAASSCRCGVGSTASPYRCHAASSAAPPPSPLPPRGPSPHTVICVTDPNPAGGRGRRWPAHSFPSGSGRHLSSSLVTRLRPSPPHSLRIGGNRTSGARRAE